MDKHTFKWHTVKESSLHARKLYTSCASFSVLLGL